MSTTFSQEERDEYMKYMTADYMSSEHSMSESEGKGENHSDSGSDTECKRMKVLAVSTFPRKV